MLLRLVFPQLIPPLLSAGPGFLLEKLANCAPAAADRATAFYCWQIIEAMAAARRSSGGDADGQAYRLLNTGVNLYNGGYSPARITLCLTKLSTVPMFLPLAQMALRTETYGLGAAVAGVQQRRRQGGDSCRGP